MRERDVSLEDYRAAVRAQKLQSAATFRQLCNELVGLSLDEATRVFANLPAEGTPAPIAGATPKPGQKESPEATRQIAAVFLEECR